jgi:hypothetical protein
MWKLEIKMNENAKKKIGITIGVFVFLEVILAFFLLSPFTSFVSGGAGGNVTVQTFLDVGASYPEILNITVDDYASEVMLTANSTKIVTCTALMVDYNNDTDMINLSGVFYDSSVSDSNPDPTTADDNNDHYTNSSCDIKYDTGDWGAPDDEYNAIGNCTFEVHYYANPGDWNCSMTVTDNDSLSTSAEDDIIMADLLAVGLPDSINYGTVNATYVSLEQVAAVSNAGNVELNLSLSGYAQTEGDGLAMNCSSGRDGVIPIDHEKYNLTETTPGEVSLTVFENLYLNLTSSPVVKEFNLNARQDDVIDDAVKDSFWRIYVPRGAAGTCQGNIVFGATQFLGS